MKDNYDVMLLYRIANDYYINNLSQREIAEKEFMSRSQISRLLDKAKELGIIQFKVSVPEVLRYTELASLLEEKLQLKKVLIASNPAGKQDSDALAKTIATLASVEVGKLFKNGSIVGMGWGKTLYHFSMQLPYRKDLSESTYVPLIGLTDTMNPYLQINNIIDRIAEKHGSNRYYMHLPYQKLKQIPYSTQELRRLEDIRELWNRMDIAIIGLGSKIPGQGMSDYGESSYLYYEKMWVHKTVGEILGQFFYNDSTICQTDLEQYDFLAYDIMKLRTVQNVICLAGGENKIEGLITAAKNKFFTHLITDQKTAKLLLDY